MIKLNYSELYKLKEFSLYFGKGIYNIVNFTIENDNIKYLIIGENTEESLYMTQSEIDLCIEKFNLGDLLELDFMLDSGIGRTLVVNGKDITDYSCW